MRYQVLATDYDGTLAHNGRVDESTVTALEKLLATGRRLILVTGRELPDLLAVFPQIELFELVVAENGALLYRPGTREQHALAESPSPKFIQTLRQRGVQPISIGKVIVATWTPHEQTVLRTIRDCGFELQVIFNKGAVMILPTGVNKASGLLAALKELEMSPHNVVAVGDAENDHAMLHLCEFSIAVANALPALEQSADWVTRSDHGAGVVELIEQMIANDLRELDYLLEPRLTFGFAGGEEIRLSPYGPCVLIAGPSASGKSTVATAILEALTEQKYQFCVIDPEGDYEMLENAVVLGGPQSPPSADELLKLLANPEQNVVVSLTGMPIGDRPPFFLSVLPRLLQLRARTGRPHWLLLDEAHHLMPAEWKPSANLLPEQWHNALLITVHPDLLARPVLERVDNLLAVGPDAAATIDFFSKAVGEAPPKHLPGSPRPGELLFWRRGDQPILVRARPTETERRRHRRKYSEGELPPERSFYFRGPNGKLNIRAQNLMMFLQLGDGVDDDTWNLHLKNGDFARWFREKIKDEKLSAEADRIAGLPEINAKESRAHIRAAIEHDYTLPASRIPAAGAG